MGTVWLLWEWNDGDDTGDFLIGVYTTQDAVVRQHQGEGWDVTFTNAGAVTMVLGSSERYAYPQEIIA